MPGSVGPRGVYTRHASTLQYEWEYIDTQAYVRVYIERSASHLLNLGFVVQCGNSVDIRQWVTPVAFIRHNS